MTVDGLGCLIWWELGFQPEIVDLRIIKKKKKKNMSQMADVIELIFKIFALQSHDS